MLLALLIFILFVTTCIVIMIQKKLEFQEIVVNLLLVCIVCVCILIYPLITQYRFVVKVLNVLFYALESTVMNQDTSILKPLLTQGIFYYIYYIILQSLFVLMPILTIGIILNYITGMIKMLKFWYATNSNEIHVFSEMNSKSEFFAKNLLKNNKDNESELDQKIFRKSIIFTSKDNKKAHVKSLKMGNNITDISIKNNSKKIFFYALSLNEEKNITDGLKLIQKYKNYTNVTIYVLCNDKNSSIIFDSVDKGRVTLEIINEVERTIYHLLDTHPLFLDIVDKTISILIIGCGEVGLEFLRDATWCSIMPGIKYRATIIDLKANEIKEKIEVESPEFLNHYDISFIEANYKSYETLKFIKNNKEVNYIFLSMDTDKKNLDAAILLRGYYLKMHDRLPSIHLWCRDDGKMNQINQMKTRNNSQYCIHAFGSDKDIYYGNMIINSKFERIVMDVHSASKEGNLTDQEKRKNYNDMEYNKRSSRASALHIKYKFYSVLGDSFTSDMHKNQQLFKKIYQENTNIKNILMDCEHDRWNAYLRSIGYTCISVNEVSKYYKQEGGHENSLTKQHPALVENKDLDKVSEGLKQYNSKIDLRKYDKKILDRLVNGTIRL